ncbi:hypothetical protein N8D74_09210 [Curtobacterium flaccumfaciens]|nr:hypothetical protein [Curtobacterium flaccumfaciens]UXN27124.1 hypothetical protein N8D74_09210 [Curtobacterium flaccumfaciens]
MAASLASLSKKVATPGEEVLDPAGHPPLDPLRHRDRVVDRAVAVDDRRDPERGAEHRRATRGAADRATDGRRQPTDDVLHARPGLLGVGEVRVALLDPGERDAAQVRAHADDPVQAEVHAEHGTGRRVRREALGPTTGLVRGRDRLGLGHPPLVDQVGQRGLDRGAGEADRAPEVGDRAGDVVAQELVEDRPRVHLPQNARGRPDGTRGR